MSSGDPTKISPLPPGEVREADTEKENTELEIGSGAAAPLVLVDENPPKGSRPVTKAERWFDTTLYGGFMGIFNAVYSVWMGDEVREGRGKAFFEKTAEHLARRMTPESSAGELAKNTQRIKATGINMVLTGCGIMLLLPMKWFENRKPQFVRSIQENWIKPKNPEQAAKDEAALQQLDKTPALGWGPIITGRAIGMAGPFTASWYAADLIQHVENAAEKFATQGLNFHSVRAKRYSRMISLELLYTGICTSGLYIYTHFINPPKRKTAAAPEQPAASNDQPTEDNTNISPPDKNTASPAADTKSCAPCRFLKYGNSHAEKAAHSQESAPSLQLQA